MDSNDQTSYKKYTLSFNTIIDLLAFQKTVNPKGYLMVPQVNILSGKFCGADIDLAVNQFHAVITSNNIDVNELINK